MESTGQTIPTSPEKDIFDTLVADISYEDAICELIDNAIDSAHRLENTDSVRIDVTYSSSPEEGYDTKLSVKDNGGGIQRENLAILTKLSSSQSSDLDASIGTYGVGAKRACAKLGSDALILSRHQSSSVAFGFKIPSEWYEEDDWRDFTEIQDDSLSAGSTEVTIYDVSYGFDAESLSKHISRTYAKYLRGEASELDVSIYVNGEEVEPPSGVNWSYTPFDFHPRQYPDIPIMPEERDMDEPVYLTITVGILRGSDGENEPGTDIYCQGRKVVHADQGRKGGHVRQYLREWSNDKGRFKIVLEFDTEGDNKHLPWTSTKADIDVSSLVYMEGMDWARKVADAHRKIGYDIPDPFIKPYSSEHEDASDIEVFGSYSEYSPDRDRIRRGDKIDYDAARGLVINIKNKADRHAKFHIDCPSSVNNEHYQGYRGRIIKTFTSTYDGVTEDDLEKIENEPQQLNQQNFETLAGDLERKAETDASEGVRDDMSLDNWQVPLYTYYLKKEAGSLASLTSLSSLEDSSGTGENTDSSVSVQTESEEQEEHIDSDSTADRNRSSEVEQSDSDRIEEEVSEDTNGDSGEETSTSGVDETDRQSDGADDTIGTEDNRQEDSSQGDGTNDESSATNSLEDPENATDSEVDSSVVLEGAEATTVPVEISPELWADLCDALGLPDSTEPSAVGEEVSELLESLVRMRAIDEARSNAGGASLD